MKVIMKKLSKNFQKGSYYCSSCGFVVRTAGLTACPHCEAEIEKYEEDD